MTCLGMEWDEFRRLCNERRLGGNEIPDAWIASAVKANGSHLVTYDRGFARLLRARDLTILGSPTWSCT